MWKILLLCTLAEIGQTAPINLLLPTKQHISGVIVDQSGNPVSDAVIDDTDDAQRIVQTDSTGRFDLNTAAPALVIRKPGFESHFFRTTGATEVTFILRPSEPAKEMKPCPADSKGFYKGFGFLRFPRVAGVKQSAVETEQLEGSLTTTFSAGRKGALIQGGGFSWGDDRPPARLVWAASAYEETIYQFEVPGEGKARRVMDARGRLANGKLWRNLSTDGESAEYSGLDDGTAARLNQLLDGACARRPPAVEFTH